VVARQEQEAAKLRQASADLTQIHEHLRLIHTIGREAVSAADPFEVLALAARAPVQLAQAIGSSIVTFGDEKAPLRLEMTWGLSDKYVQSLRHHLEAGIPADHCRHCQALTARVSDQCPLFQGLQSQARADGIASLVCLPIVCDRERVGILNAYFASPAGPSEVTLRLLNIIATEIAIALDGARLRARQMAALATVSQVTQTSTDRDTLSQVLEALLTGWAIEAGAILLYETAAGAWHSRVQRGLGDDPADPRFGLAVQLSEEARVSQRPTRWPAHSLTPPIHADVARLHGFTAALAVPLLAEGEFLGTLFLASRRPQVLQAWQTPFVTFLAHQTALVVRNAQLQLQLGHLAVLEERYRLSREMHDGLAQTLGYLGWQMDHLETLLAQGRLEPLAAELAEARRTVREAYLDVREAIDGLRLAVDHPGGLAEALREYVADFAARTGLAAEFEAGGDGPALLPVAELQLLRIAQEALTNVRKHAGAAQVRVSLSHDGSHWELTVADDGRGFDPLPTGTGSLPRRRHHLGLATMRERVQSLGGTLTIATGPGRGTRVTAIVPVAGKQ